MCDSLFYIPAPLCAYLVTSVTIPARQGWKNKVFWKFLGF